MSFRTGCRRQDRHSRPASIAARSDTGRARRRSRRPSSALCERLRPCGASALADRSRSSLMSFTRAPPTRSTRCASSTRHSATERVSLLRRSGLNVAEEWRGCWCRLTELHVDRVEQHAEAILAGLECAYESGAQRLHDVAEAGFDAFGGDLADADVALHAGHPEIGRRLELPAVALLRVRSGGTDQRNPKNCAVLDRHFHRCSSNHVWPTPVRNVQPARRNSSVARALAWPCTRSIRCAPAMSDAFANVAASSLQYR